jgi:fructose-1,6-bisphosphatase
VAALVNEIDHATKPVAREVCRWAIAGRLGTVGSANASGDAQNELDPLAHRIFLGCLAATSLVAAVVSEELEEAKLQHCHGEAPYFVRVDPNDGSSNLKMGTSLVSIRQTGETT